MNTLVEIAEKLKKVNKVAIICHVRPDGDAIGSAVGLALALQKLSINVKVFCDDVIPKKFEFINAQEFFSKKLTEDFDAIVAVDCADELRLGEENALVFSKHKNTFNIDHHISNTRFAKFNYVFDNSSNSENIYELVKCLGVEIDETLATFLFMGVMTDTGNFRHQNVSVNTFLTASKLVEKEVDVTNVYYNLFTKQTKFRAKLFGLTMESLRYFLDSRLVIGTISNEMLLKSGALLEDTEGMIDFIMGIDTVEVGILISEVGKNKYKCSFRSKKVDVNQIAGIFGGGGHVLASGCQICGAYEEVIDKLTFAVSKYIDD